MTTNLSPEELSLWIAEKMEPSPVPLSYASAGIESPLGWWLWDTGPYKCIWQPRLYSDPEIALRLLKGLIDENHAPQFVYLMNSKQVLIALRKSERRSAATLERAIAESWALANGWKESEPDVCDAWFKPVKPMDCIYDKDGRHICMIASVHDKALDIHECKCGFRWAFNGVETGANGLKESE